MPPRYLSSCAISRRHFLALAAVGGAAPALGSRMPVVGAAPTPPDAPGQQDAASLVLVEIQVLQNPSPFVADGRAHLLYELHLTSFQPAPLTLSAIQVATVGERPAPIARFEGADLAELLVRAGAAAPTEDPLVLLPGVRTMAFLELTFDSLEQVPAALSHDLIFQPARADQAPRLSRLPSMDVLPLLPVTIGPPVYGDGWLAANAASNTSRHRRAPLVVNGHLYFAQRYAIDLIQVGSDGRPYHADPAKNESWLCYGAELVAVADGVVVDVRDGIPDNVPNEAPVVPITLDTVAGNYAVVDLGNGRSGDYAHMIPGSIRVKPGDRVRRGDVLGLLGNSGNSTAPHLHFHVTDRPAFVEADGVPYAFDRLRVWKTRIVPIGDDDFEIEVLSDRPRVAVNELVLENDLLGFDRP
jgi:hypothetical protein